MPNQFVALLRGINVGGKNKLPMRDLVALFRDAGCENVRTYIQSGNVLFDLHASDSETSDSLAALAASLTAAIASQLGLRVPIVMRGAEQMRLALAHNTFLDRGDPIDLLHVMFLADRPDPEKVAALDPLRSVPDEFEVRGREVFLSLPTGAGNTKLTNAYFDSKLGTIGTSRNWRTVIKLVELLGV